MTGTQPQPDFSLSVSPASRTVKRGKSTTYTVAVNRTGGFAASVSLGVSGLPPGATGSFSTNPTTGSSTLSVRTSSSTPAGTFALTVTGTAAGVTRSTSTSLQVNRR